jgi:GAF domain-containing protein/HAMP domain-containing protein
MDRPGFIPAKKILPPSGQSRSLRWRLLGLLAVTLTVTLVLIGAAVWRFVVRNEQVIWAERQREAAGLAARVVQDFVERHQHVLQLVSLAEREVIAGESPLLREMIEQTPALLEIVRLDENGAVLASTYADAPLLANLFTLPQSTWFLTSQAGDLYLGEILISSQSKPYLIIAVPTPDQGVAAARLNAEALWQTVRDLGFGKTGQAYVVNQAGLIVAHTDQRYAIDNTSLAERPEFQAMLKAPEQTWHDYYVNFTGDSVVGNSISIPGTPWILVSEVNQAEVFRISRIALELLAVGGASAAVLLMLLLSWFTSRLIFQPMQRLQEGATRLGQGMLSHRIDLPHQDEVGRVAAAFNAMAGELQAVYDSLETRVADRTRRLEIVALLGEQLNAILDLDQLLQAVVDQVKVQFGYYHAQIYLFDEARLRLVLAAGAGEVGAQLKAAGHSLRADAPTNLVARAARTGEMVNEPNVRKAEDWLPNPMLPNTTAELAVPVVLEGQVVGVLDVQADEVGGVDESDQSLLRTLASQVAVAMRNAQQFATVQAELKKAQAAQEKYLEQAWDKSRSLGRVTEYLYSLPGSPDLSEATLDQLQGQALGQQQPALVPFDPAEAAPKSLVAPVKLGDAVIGALQLHRADVESNEPVWDEDDLDLVAAVLDQVAQTAETLRLFDETRERVTREQVVREITDKLRAAPNLDLLLETAARELGQRLETQHTVLRLGIDKKRLLTEEPK